MTRSARLERLAAEGGVMPLVEMDGYVAALAKANRG